MLHKDLYDLSLYLYSFSKMRRVKCCTKIFLEAFQAIYAFTSYEFPDIESINRRYVNCFLKAFARSACDRVKLNGDKKATKRRRLADR